MPQSINASGWVVEGDNVVLCPVVGFKVKPIMGGACALQFNYFADKYAVEKNEVRAVQLVMPLDSIEQLRKALEQVEEHVRSRSDGVAS